MIKTIDEQFKEFHEANPEVYIKLRQLARKAVAGFERSGKPPRIGIGMLWEVMRWDFYLYVASPDEFKLNNNFRSRYARLLMENEPDLKDVFETRVLRSEEVG